MIVQELKKIFAIKRVALILVLGVLFFIIFFQRNVGIPVYSSERINLDVSESLSDMYGAELDEEEYKEFLKSVASTQESKIDQWIKENPSFEEHGIESYRDLLNIQDSLTDAVAGDLTSQISKEFTGEEQQEALDQMWKENYIDVLAEAYDKEIYHGGSTSYYVDLTEEELQRVDERNKEEVYSLMPDRVINNYLSIFPDFSIFLIISVVFLVVPYSVKDTMNGINILQYGSKNGCSFYWKKGFAVLTSSLVLCAIESALFLFMLYKNHALSFWNCFVSGFGSSFISFIKLTFGQYVGLSLGYIILLGVSIAMITFSLSSCAHNYISAISMQIPIVVAGIVCSLTLMPHFAEITQNILLLYGVLAMSVLGAIIGNIVRYISIKRYERI